MRTTNDTREPAFIRVLLVTIVTAVLAVALIANGAAYLSGVSFVHDVMRQPITIARIFGGVIELALGAVALSQLIESWRLHSVAKLRTATWTLSAVSGLFGSLYEVVEYATGDMTLVAAVSSAAWRMFLPFLAAGLWELAIYLLCGKRHRAHRAAETMQLALHRLFAAGEREGLAHGTWRAPLAAMASRAAARRISRLIPDADARDAAIARELEAQRYAAAARVQTAALANGTRQIMRERLHAYVHQVMPAPASADAPLPAPAPAPAPAQMQVQAKEFTPLHVQTVAAPAPVQLPMQVQGSDYAARATASVQREAAAIVRDTRTITTTAPAPGSDRLSSASQIVRERRDWLRQYIEQHAQDDMNGRIAWKLMTGAGFTVGERSAKYDLSAVRDALASASA